jgi:hypothetical protein
VTWSSEWWGINVENVEVYCIKICWLILETMGYSESNLSMVITQSEKLNVKVHLSKLKTDIHRKSWRFNLQIIIADNDKISWLILQIMKSL